jgi:hypothetical protein
MRNLYHAIVAIPSSIIAAARTKSVSRRMERHSGKALRRDEVLDLPCLGYSFGPIRKDFVLRATIDGPSAWRRADLRGEDYRVDLSPACLDEIRRLADALRSTPAPTDLRRPQNFALPHCRAAMAEVRRIVQSGVRFAIVDRLPLDELGDQGATEIYWQLALMVARPVQQSLEGRLVYDVRDTGRQALPGSGVRPDQTNIDLKFHTDNSYNTTPPECIVLLCLRTAKSGGHSRVASFHTLHNALVTRHAEALPRLYQPFWFDRQREFHEGEPPVFAAPV